jgi:hypothetical protein
MAGLALSATCLACGSGSGGASESAPDGAAPGPDGAAQGADGGAATEAATEAGLDCTPDDGVADPPCAGGEQMRCNGKCFAKLGECKAGCWLVATARNTRGILFENGIAYNYNGTSLTRTDLSTYAETHIEAYPGTPTTPSATLGVGGVVVKNGVAYAYDGAWLDKADSSGSFTQWVKTPLFTIERIAVAGDTIYLIDGSSNLATVSISTQAAASVTVTGGPSVFGLGYDDAYLYWTGSPANSGGTTGTYRAAAADGLAMSQSLGTELMSLDGPIYGAYLYERVGTMSPTWRRMPKTGGAAQDFLSGQGTVGASLLSTTAVNDAFYGLDPQGQVHRFRSTADDAVVARVDPTQVQMIGSDGMYAYVATGANANGGLFRILEP